MARVVYLVSDLLFVSKIRETAQTLGLELESCRTPEKLAAAAASAQLVIIDLRRPDALAVLGALPAGVPSVGFIDHERVDVMEAARARGCRAFAKGKFTSELPALLAALS
ncbi:MAG: hypothetical protein ACHQ17_10635 [Polyangia bacterium]|jgi:hypothetical protein